MLEGRGILTAVQRKCLSVFSGLADQVHFYLSGGTALAEYYLGHRLSFDLDLFTSQEGLIPSFSRSIERAFSQAGWGVDVVRRFASHVEMALTWEGDTLRLDLALDSPFKWDACLSSEQGVRVNGYRDLIAEKTLAYYGRSEPRDAVDLFFILERESLADLMDLASRKDRGFDGYWFAAALNKSEGFPDDAERWPVRMLVPFDPVELKRIFRASAMEIMSRVVG
jgi:hypothetical protein